MEQIENQDASENELSLACKRKIKKKRSISIKLGNLSLTYKEEATPQQMTTNVQAVGSEMIDDSSKEDYMHKSIFKQEPENVATLSEKNVKKIKVVRKKLKQNRNEEEMKTKNKKKLKNIEVIQQQMTTNVKAIGDEMIDDSSEEDYIHWSIFIEETENSATLSEKNVKEIKDVPKKLEQNKIEEKDVKIDENKLKNIEETQQQMTTTVEVSHNNIITEPNKADCIRVPVYIRQSENFATLSEKNVKEIKDVPKKLEQNRNEEKDEKIDENKLKNIEETQQQITTTVEVSHNDIITEPNKVDCIRVPVYIRQSENFATLSEKNVKEIKDVRKKLDPNKNEEKMEKKNKKKSKIIEVTHQQMTKNVKAVGGEMIDDSSKEDYMHKSIFKQEPENVATLSEKNVKKIKAVRKKLKQNRNEEEIKTKNKKKLKNIEVIQQQMTTNVKAIGDEMIDDSSEEDYMRWSIFIQENENFATLSDKNVKEIKDVPKKLEQNKIEEKDVKIDENKLKNIEETQQQMTTTVEVSHNDIITEPNKADCIRVPVYIRQSENFATLSEKNVKEIKDVPKKLEQNRNEEKDEKIDKNKLKNIEETQQQITTTVEVSHNDIITEPNKVDCIRVPVYIRQSENFATLSKKNVKEIKDVRKKSKQNKNEEEMENKNKKKLKNIEVTHQQMTKNVKAVGGEMSDDSSKEDYMHKSIFKQEPENVATLSEKNVKKIKAVRKKLKQNRNEEEIKTKNKKKLKNIEVIQQEMTTNVKAGGDEMIDDSSEEDYMRWSIFIQENENFATLSDKNVKEIKDVRKKLKQNKNEEQMEKKSEKKLKNIEVTHQQMTKNVKGVGGEMIDDSSKEDYMHKSIFEQEPENVATLSKKNVKKIKDVRKKLKQNRNEEEMKIKNKKKLKNIELTHQQMTKNVKAVDGEMIDDSSKENYMHKSIFEQEPENVATLSEKNVKKIKAVRKKLKQNKNEEQMEKKSEKKLKNIEVTQQQMTTNVKAAGAEMIDDSSEEDYIHWYIFIQETENFATLSEKNVKEIKDVRKKLEQNKKEKKEKIDKNKFKNIGETQQQMTTTVEMSQNDIITEPNKVDCIRVPVYIRQSENFATLSEKNVKKIKDVPKKLEQNKNEEKKKIDKNKFKNIEETQQQMTTTVEMSQNDIITEPNKVDCIRVPVYIRQSENFATLSEKNVKEIKDVPKKLEQNKNEEKEKIDKNKLKNIEETQQQMTTIVEVSHNDIITEPNKADCTRVPVYIRQSENVATLSEKNVKEIKDVPKKLKQNKNEEKEKIDKNKLKNIEETQMTTIVEVSHNDIINEPNKAGCMCVPVCIRQSENFATLPEKNDKKIKYVPEKFEQSPEQVDKNSLTKLLTDSEEKMNKILNNETKAIKLLADIETKDESIIIRKQIRGEDKDISSPVIYRQEMMESRDYNHITLPTTNITNIETDRAVDNQVVPMLTKDLNKLNEADESLEQIDKESLTKLLINEEKTNKMLNNETKAIKLLKDIKTNDESIIIRTQIRGEDKVTDAKIENDDVNNSCQISVNNKSKEHGYTLNEIVEKVQVIKVVEENEIKEVENTGPGTTSIETLSYGKVVILENNSKMTNETLMVEDISNVAHKIDKQIVWKNWRTIYIENMFSRLSFLFILLLLFLLFCNCE